VADFHCLLIILVASKHFH